MTLKVLTANRLLDGVSVWFNANGEWVESLTDAFIARHDEAVQTLTDIGQKAVADNFIVDVALIDVEETENGLLPKRMRERIRAKGPTVAYGYEAAAQNQTRAA